MYNTKMNTIFMNSKNSHRLLLNKTQEDSIK